MEPDLSLTDRIAAALPQTQCRQCGFDGCLPYASAIARGDAGINQCPPGGANGIARIAIVVGRTATALNPDYGIEKPLALAVIDEAVCIGCTLCIQACPVDAIVGAARRMHDVIPELCTGCELCVPPCPVDCISMVPAGFIWDDTHAHDAKRHYEARNRRLLRERSTAGQRRAATASTASTTDPASRKKAIIAAAVARAAHKREAAR